MNRSEARAVAEELYKLMRNDVKRLVKEAVGKSSVSCPLKPSDSAPLKHSTMPP